jgi:hypothetical protein
MPQAEKQSSKTPMERYDQALADIRVAGAIAHACSLALWSDEVQDEDALANALAYAYEAGKRAAENLVALDIDCVIRQRAAK